MAHGAQERARPWRELIGQAGSPEQFYGDPVARDSLVELLAAGGDSSGGRWTMEQLCAALDTPWPLHFEVARLALRQAGEPARAALAERLKRDADPVPLPALLTVFQELGRPGDEPVLARALAADDPSGLVGAARCLASFGQWEHAFPLLEPLTGHAHPQVRLAAAWALGEVFQRQPSAAGREQLAALLRPLLADPEPRVRFTAAELLRRIEGESSIIPAPLTPGQQP